MASMLTELNQSDIESLLPSVFLAVVKLTKNNLPILRDTKSHAEATRKVSFGSKSLSKNILTFGSGSINVPSAFKPSYTQCPAVWIHWSLKKCLIVQYFDFT